MDFYEWERVFDKCSTPSIGKNCDHVAWSFTQLWTDMQIQCFGELTSVIFTLQKCHPFSEEPYWPLLSLNEAYFFEIPTCSQSKWTKLHGGFYIASILRHRLDLQLLSLEFAHLSRYLEITMAFFEQSLFSEKLIASIKKKVGPVAANIAAAAEVFLFFTSAQREVAISLTINPIIKLVKPLSFSYIHKLSPFPPDEKKFF